MIINRKSYISPSLDVVQTHTIHVLANSSGYGENYDKTPVDDYDKATEYDVKEYIWEE